MKIFLARHSQTNYNRLGLCNSDPAVDVHLSATGIKQTKKLAAVMAPLEFEAVYISELPRTRQTAEIINEFHNKPLIVDSRLNDNKTGYENKPAFAWHLALKLSGDPWNASFHGGESLNEAAARAEAFLADLKESGYESVLVVTHRFITQALYGYMKHISLEEASNFKVAQGTYATFEY